MMRRGFGLSMGLRRMKVALRFTSMVSGERFVAILRGISIPRTWCAVKWDSPTLPLWNATHISAKVSGELL